MFNDWVLMLVRFLAGLTRLLSIAGLVATLGGLLMQKSEGRFICFVICPVGSFVFYAISAQLFRLGTPSKKN